MASISHGRCLRFSIPLSLKSKDFALALSLIRLKLRSIIRLYLALWQRHLKGQPYTILSLVACYGLFKPIFCLLFVASYVRDGLSHRAIIGIGVLVIV